MPPSTPAPASSDADVRQLGSSTSAEERALVAAGVLLVAAAALSGSDLLSTLSAAAAVVLGAWPIAVRFRRCIPTQLACGIAAFWLVYAAVLGSLPPLGDAGAVADWASAEGRAFLALYAIAVGASFTSRRSVSDLVGWIVAAVAVSLVVGLVSHWFHVGPPPFDHRSRRLFHGLTSSHHVSGFLGAGLVVIVAAVPGLFRRWVRVATLLIGVLAIALAGSRSSLVGLGVGIVVVLAHLLDRRRAVLVVVAMTAAAALVLLPVPRFRQTVEIVTRPEFLSDVAAAFDDGTKQGARQLSDSEAEANMLIRFALWGEEFDVIRSSPLVGIGRFRGNDDEVELRGVDGLVYVAVDGVRSPFGQPHNMYLLLLGETGIVGLLLFASPYVVAVRRTRRASIAATAPVDDSDGDGDEDDDAHDDGAAIDRDGTTPLPATMSWSYWTGPEVAGPPEPAGWRALSRGSLAVGLTIGFFSASLMTTGLGLILNLLVFGAAAAYTDAVAAAGPVDGEASS